MTFINEIKNPSEKPKIPKIKVYKSYKSEIVYTTIATCFVLFIIVVNGLFPKPVMNFMEKIGLIAYTEVTDAKIKYVRDYLEYLRYLPGRHHSTRSDNKTSFSPILVGEYRAKDNNLYEADIYLFSVYHDYVHEKYLQRNNNKIEIAYLTFYPRWHFLKRPSRYSIHSVYAFLPFTLLFLFVHLYLYYRTKSILTKFSVGKFVCPDAYIVKLFKHNYEYYLIWNTPEGKKIDSLYTYSSSEHLESLDFNNMYCAIYLKTSSGRSMIIHPADVESVAKKYGYAFENNYVKLTKKNR